jgi:Ca-activated chloride channel family protein
MNKAQVSGFGVQDSLKRRLVFAILIFSPLVFIVASVLVFSPEPRTLNPLSPSFWFTPEQQGDRLMRQKKFAEAAKNYRDPLRIGVALYRAGEFKAAGHAFGRVKTAEGLFNQGNALVMQGKYTDAVEALEKALEKRPGWREAEVNLEIARLRAENMKQEGGDMGEPHYAADEIVFTSGKKDGAGEEEIAEGGEKMSDQTLQAMWLRRIQTKPADFLRAKFSYQLAQEGDK